MQVACVAVDRHHAVRVLDHYAVSVAVVPRRQDDRTRFRGVDRRSVRRGDINAAVTVVSAVAVHHLGDLTAVAADRPQELSDRHVIRYASGDSRRLCLCAHGDYLGRRLLYSYSLDDLAAGLNAVDVGNVRGNALGSLYALLHYRGGSFVMRGILGVRGVVGSALVVGLGPRDGNRKERLLLVYKDLIADEQRAVH